MLDRLFKLHKNQGPQSDSGRNSLQTKNNVFYRREFNLPQNAIDGLRNAIISCDRPAKQLQNEADQLANKLEQRRFPESPEKLKKFRDEVKRKLKSGKKGEISDFDKEAFGGKVVSFQVAALNFSFNLFCSKKHSSTKSGTKLTKS